MFVIVLMVWLSEVEVNETVFEDQLEQAIATYTYFTFVKSALTLHRDLCNRITFVSLYEPSYLPNLTRKQLYLVSMGLRMLKER